MICWIMDRSLIFIVRFPIYLLRLQSIIETIISIFSSLSRRQEVNVIMHLFIIIYLTLNSDEFNLILMS